jgi:type I site-specific restriction-modification system R (restriction) subunit
MAGFQKAIREDIFVKVCTIAPSGGGKSYSTLRMATGLSKALSQKTGTEERIAYIGSEGSRDKYYANEFDYDLLQLKNDFSPEKYMDALGDALESGYKIIVIDSISHEWAGKNGCLEIHSKMAGNSYTNWNKVTPRHNKLMDLILDCEAHVIVTVRGKDKYVMEEVNGKQVVTKLNLGYQQRDDIEYLFTLSLNIEKDSHMFTSLKDNTHIFEDRNDVLTEKDGEKLFQWATNGDIKTKRQELEKAKEEAKIKIAMNEENEAKKIIEEKQAKTKEQKETPLAETKEIEKKPSLANLKKEILALCKDLSVKGNRDAVISVLKEANNDDANPSNIKDVDVAEKALKALKEI